METDPVSETLLLLPRSPDDGKKSKNPVIGVGVFIKIPFLNTVHMNKITLFITLLKELVLRSDFTSENPRFNATPLSEQKIRRLDINSKVLTKYFFGPHRDYTNITEGD
jgi:hypothetical protein